MITSLAGPLTAALSWNPQIRGALYVVIAVAVLPGSAYLLLATNVGSRLGFQLAAAGLSGWIMTLGMVWWVYGRGPVGPSGSWKPVETVVGDPGQAGREEVLEGFPDGWKKLEPSDPAVADAQPVADGLLTGDSGMFESASDYLVVQAAEIGGEDKGPLGLNFRPFDVFHEPHYLLIQAQKTLEQETPEGGAPPKPAPDPSAQPVSIVMVRDLGAVRLHPAIVTISSGLIFGLLVYTLHRRDQDMAERLEGEDSPAR